jgi:chromosome segregation ATPase
MNCSRKLAAILSLLFVVLWSPSLLASQSLEVPTGPSVGQTQTFQDLQKSYQALEQSYKERGTLLISVMDDLTQQILILQSAQANLRTSQSNLESLRLSSTELVSKLQTLQDELADYKTKLQALQTELDDFKVKLKTSEDNLAVISASFRELLTKFSKLTTDYQELSTRYEALSVEYKKVSDQLGQAQANLDQALNVTIPDLKKQLKDAQGEMLLKMGIGAGVGGGAVGLIWLLVSLLHS